MCERVAGTLCWPLDSRLGCNKKERIARVSRVHVMSALGCIKVQPECTGLYQFAAGGDPRAVTCASATRCV